MPETETAEFSDLQRAISAQHQKSNGRFAELKTQMLAVARFLGRPALIVLGMGCLGSLLLAFAEFGVALFIQVFLVSIGVMPREGLKYLGDVEISLAAAGGLLALVAVIRAFGQFFVGLSSGHSSALMQQRLRTVISAHMLFSHAPPVMTKIHSLLSEAFPKASNFAFSASNCFSYCLQMCALCVAMMAVAWKEASVALVLLFFVGLFVLRVNKSVRRAADNLPQQQEAIVGSIERIAANWMLVFVLNTRLSELRRTRTAIDDQTTAAKRSHFLAGVASSSSPFLGILILILVVGLSQTTFETSPSKLLVFLYLFVRFVQNLSSAATTFGLSNSFYVYFKQSLGFFTEANLQYQEALSAQNSVASSRTQDTPFSDKGQEPASVVIENLTFRYQADSEPILSDWSLQMSSGSQVGIVGPSGSGKSTILSLVLGVLRPTKGKVLINGQPAFAQIRERHVRAAYVGPEPFLFEGTLRENLQYGSGQKAIDDREMQDVLSSLDMKPEDSNWNAYLGQWVAAGGKNFSTGQRQRICFSRAMLQNPQLLVLDEVSANLDSATEHRLTEWLEKIKGRCTTIIVTHRPAILKHADHVIDLKAQAK